MKHPLGSQILGDILKGYLFNRNPIKGLPD